MKKEYEMSSEKNDKKTDSKKMIESVWKNFMYYFDIFYRVSKSLMGIFIAVLLVLGSLGAGTAIGYFASLVHGSEIPEYEEMEEQITNINNTSTMYYAGGEEVSDLRTDLVRSSLDLENISPLLIDAVIATEDEYFYEHQGVVPKATARALVQDLTQSATTSGGSTLTQQLIKQQIIGDEVSHERKANEILLAMRIENYLEKEEILEAYLNISPFGRNNKGQNIAGVEEAAQGIFGVSASEVSLPQAAYIAGLPQSPITYSPYTQYGDLKENSDAGVNRQQSVLFYMFREGVISEEEYQNAREYDITADFLNQEELDYEDMSYVYDLGEHEAQRILFNHLLEEDEVSREQLQEDEDLRAEYTERANNELRNGGYRIYTTIDRDIHRTLEQTVTERRDELGNAQEYTWTDSDTGETHTETFPIQIGGSLIENSTGRVIAFVGGRDYNESQYNIPFNSERQPGSTIKPLVVYGPALAEGMITPATIIPDTDFSVPHWQDGVQTEHSVTNYGRTTNEWRSARHWLSVSQNIPASKTFMEMRNNGIDPSVYARRMGLDQRAISDAEFDNPSLALGGTDYGPTITDMVGAYASIANGGVHNDPYVIDRIEDSQGNLVYEHELSGTEVWDAQTNFLLLDMLRDVHESGTASGMMSQLNFNTDLFSKTGTTNNSSDLWYIGATPQVTFGTWIGYDNQNISVGRDFGISPSQRNRNMWAHLMNAINSTNSEIIGADASHGGAPEGVTQQSVLNETGMQAGNVNLPGGETASISGDSHTEYFASSDIPGTTAYDFALGATDEELAEFWNNRTTPEEEVESSDSEETNEEESSEDENEDETSSEEDSDEEGNVEEENQSEGENEEENNDENTE